MRFNIILKLAYKFALHILKADQSGSLDDFGAVIYGEIVTIGEIRNQLYGALARRNSAK